MPAQCVSSPRCTPSTFSLRVSAARCASAFGVGVSIHVAVGCARPARLSVSDSPPLNQCAASCILVVLVLVIPRCSLVCWHFRCFRFSISFGVSEWVFPGFSHTKIPKVQRCINLVNTFGFLFFFCWHFRCFRFSISFGVYEWVFPGFSHTQIPKVQKNAKLVHLEKSV